MKQMNANLDGNTAALNAYELDQEKLLRAAEIAADDKEMRLDDLILAEIETDGLVALEAIGTEATLESIHHVDKRFREALMEAIQCKGSKAQGAADKDLGKIFRELTYEYIAHSMEDLI